MAEPDYLGMALGEVSASPQKAEPKKLVTPKIRIQAAAPLQAESQPATEDDFLSQAIGEVSAPPAGGEVQPPGPGILSKFAEKARAAGRVVRRMASGIPEAPKMQPAAAQGQSEMREMAPGEFQHLELPPSKATQAFSQALVEAAAGPLGAAGTIRATNPIPEPIRAAIEKASTDLGVAVTPPIVDFIANSPAPDAFTEAGATIEVTGQDGTVTKVPVKTMSDAYTYLFKEPIKPIAKLKEAGRRMLTIDRGDFNQDSDFQNFLLQAAEAGSAVGTAAVELVPETPGQAAVDLSLIGLPTMFSLMSRGGLSAEGSAKIARTMKIMAGDTRLGVAGALREARAAGNLRAEALAQETVGHVKRFMESLRQVAAEKGGQLGFADLEAARAQTQPAFGKDFASNALDKAAKMFGDFATEMRAIIPARLRKAEAGIQKALAESSAGAEQIDLPLEYKRRLSDTFERVASQSRGAKLSGLAEASKRTPDIIPSLFREPRARIVGWGPEGQQFVKLADSWRDDSVRLAASVMAKIRPVLESMTPAEAEAVGAVLDPIRLRKGDFRIPAGSAEKVRAGAQAIQDAVRPLIERMRKTGSSQFIVPETGEFDKFQFSPKNLFAYFYDFEDKGVREALLKKLTQTLRSDPNFMASLKNVPNSEQAFSQAVLDNYKAVLSSLHKGRMSFPERSRELGKLGVKGFVKDPLPVFEEVVRSWANRVSRIEHFGHNDEIVKTLITKLKEQGRDGAYIDRVWRNLTEGILPNQIPLADKFLAYNIYTKMGLSALRNMTQFATNTTAKVGFGNVIRAVSDYAASHGKDQTTKMFDEVVLGSMRTLLSEATGVAASEFGGPKLLTRRMTPEQFLKAVRFSSVERINRVLSGLAGRHYALEQAGMLERFGLKNSTGLMAKDRLIELGFNDKELGKIIKTGKLTPDQEIRAGQKIINATQFQTGALDVPLFWQDDMGRILTQFKAFGFRQTKFLADNLLKIPKNAGEGINQLGFLTRFGLISQAMGIPTQTVHDFISGKPFEQTAAGRQLDMAKNAVTFGQVDKYDVMRELMANIGSTSGLGLFSELAGVFAPEVVGLEKPARLASVLLGPTVSDVGQLSEAAYRVGAGKGPRRFNETGRFLTQRLIPLAAAATGSPAATLAAAAASRMLAREAFPRKGEKPGPAKEAIDRMRLQAQLRAIQKRNAQPGGER